MRRKTEHDEFSIANALQDAYSKAYERNQAECQDPYQTGKATVRNKNITQLLNKDETNAGAHTIASKQPLEKDPINKKLSSIMNSIQRETSIAPQAFLK